MAVEFHLPDLGEGMTEAELMRWLVKPGDRVALDQAIAEVQTDKAVVSLPSPAAGVVLQLNVAEGQTVPVETLLLTIEDVALDGAPVAGAGSAPSQFRETTIPSPRAGDDLGARIPSPRAGDGPGVRAPAPVEREGVRGDGRAVPAGTGPEGAGRWSAAAVAPQRRALATPAVRRLARELGIDIATVRGSGPAGRVLAGDLRAAVTPATEATPVAAASLDAVPMEADETPAESGPAEERLPLRGLRRRIAENMVLSTSTIPQVTSLVEVDAAALVALRRSVLPAAETQGVKLSYLPFIVKALVGALRAYPYINATIDDDSKEIVLKRHYHIGIATATPDGLLVPVLRHADRLTVMEIARELGRLAEQGRLRKLPREDLRGSTFTISNYGAVGGYFATPLINPGEAAILGLGRIAERPWVVDGRVEPRPILPLSFTADHRLIDGELAMRFLGSLIATLENPNLLMLGMR